MPENNRYFLGLGSNLGDRQQTLQTAIEEIGEFATVKSQSSIYETDPVGYKDQGKFLNMALEIASELTPLELIFRTSEIEHKLGRERTIKNGPRTIDIDILLYNNRTFRHQYLQIPHPHLHKRAFVLEPLNEIAPEAIHPEQNQTIKQLWTNLKSKN